MINNVTLVGRLTKDPELRYTGSGIAVVSFTVAIDRSFSNAQGQRETDFINCVAWRGLAETLANLAVKGSLVGVTGRIQTRNYENNEGRMVYVTEVVADNFQMLEPKSVTDSRRQGGAGGGGGNYGGPQQNQGFSGGNYSTGQGGPAQSNNKSSSSDSPFDGSADFSQNPFESTEDITDISDDDLPF